VDAIEVAALLGITEGPATVLMLGAYEETAAALAQLIPEVQVVVAHADARDVGAAEVSALRTGGMLPLRAQSLRAVWLGADAGAARDALRVCGLAGRVVWNGADDEVRVLLEARGFRVIAEDAARIVAVRTA
jgi:hypothetical protein